MRCSEVLALSAISPGVPAEIADLHAYGVTRIYSPADGATMGLQGMIDDMISKADSDLAAQVPHNLDGLFAGNARDLG